MQQNTTIPQQYPPEYQSNEPQPGGPTNNGESTWKSLLSTIGIVIAAPLIALLLINFVFQSYEVDGPSMENTLHNGDRLIVLKVGKTIADLRDKTYIPERGSIIIFHKTDTSEFGSSDRQLVKRVLGLPGERVLVREGRITIYNKEHPNGFNPDSGTEYEDDLPATTMGNVDLTVPQGELFVVGDNRVNSLDSRIFGTVPAEEVVGELALRIYPFSKFETF